MINKKNKNSVANDNLRKPEFSISGFKNVFAQCGDLNSKFHWTSTIIIKINLITNVYDSKAIDSIILAKEVNKIISLEDDDVQISVSPHRTLTEKQIKFIGYLNNKLLPVVMKFYSNVKRDLSGKYEKDKKFALIPRNDLPTFNYDSNIILMFTDDVIHNNLDKQIYLNQVKMKMALDIKNNLVSVGLLRAIKGKDVEIINQAIENIKLVQEYINQNSKKGNLNESNFIVYEENISEKEKSEVIEFKKDVIKISNCDKLIWLGSFPQLKLLLILLQKYGAIPYIMDDDSECEQYMSLFIDKNGKKFNDLNPRMITWHFKISDLAYLIMKLEIAGLISESTSKKRARSIFLDEKGHTIKEDSFRNSNKKDRIPRHKSEIDEIIIKVKEVTNPPKH